MATRIVPLNDYSDGDGSHRPRSEWTLVSPAHPYLEKLATLWIQDQGQRERNIRYYLDRLPSGYALFSRARPGNPKQIDKHLYGHPDHRFFDSPNRFFPHFKHLMNNGPRDTCPCTLCETGRSRPRSNFSIIPPPINSTHQSIPLIEISSSSPPEAHDLDPKNADHLGKQAQLIAETNTEDLAVLDEREHPEPERDVLRTLIDELKMRCRLDSPFEDRLSMDWHAEKQQVTEWLDELSAQPSWIFRRAEIVLFVRHIPEGSEICLDVHSHEYKLFHDTKDRYIGYPIWEAGVIGEVPAEPVTLNDVLRERNKTSNVSITGFRVEPYPDPNSTDKSRSKQYKYLPTHHIRPFAFWREFLHGIPRHKWHPTIHNALKAMAAVSLVNRYNFKGVWPNAVVSCSGVYVGAEFVAVGDAVRIHTTPKVASQPVGPVRTESIDVLHILSIKLRLANLNHSSSNDSDDGHPYQTSIVLSGKGLTQDPTRAWLAQGQNKPIAITHQELVASFPSAMRGYHKPWYRLHDPVMTYVAPFSRAQGRLFESSAMLLWFPHEMISIETRISNPNASPSLAIGIRGVQVARGHAARHDTRITAMQSTKDRSLADISVGKSWFWADTRGEALAIHSLNGHELAGWDETRDAETLNRWSSAARVIERVASVQERQRLKEEEVAARKFAAAQATARRLGRDAVGSSMGMVIETVESDTSEQGYSRGVSKDETSEDNSGSRSSERPQQKQVHVADRPSAAKSIRVIPIPETDDEEMQDAPSEQSSNRLAVPPSHGPRRGRPPKKKLGSSSAGNRVDSTSSARSSTRPSAVVRPKSTGMPRSMLPNHNPPSLASLGRPTPLSPSSKPSRMASNDPSPFTSNKPSPTMSKKPTPSIPSSKPTLVTSSTPSSKLPHGTPSTKPSTKSKPSQPTRLDTSHTKTRLRNTTHDDPSSQTSTPSSASGTPRDSSALLAAFQRPADAAQREATRLLSSFQRSGASQGSGGARGSGVSLGSGVLMGSGASGVPRGFAVGRKRGRDEDSDDEEYD